MSASIEGTPVVDAAAGLEVTRGAVPEWRLRYLADAPRPGDLRAMTDEQVELASAIQH